MSDRIQQWTILGITMTSSFFNPLMGSAVNVALPNIAHEFSIHTLTLSWISMAYLLSAAVFLVPMGKWSDIWGRKRVFMMGNVLFLLASIMCALAPTASVLIFSRFLQGIGSSMLLSTSMAIVVSSFPANMRGRAIGLNVSAVYLGLSLAPVLGGFLTQQLGWRSLFALNAVATLLVLLGTTLAIKREWKEAAGADFDWKGALVYMPSMSLLMLGLSNLPEFWAFLFIAVGFFGLFWFVQIERSVKDPVLEMRLFFKNVVFATANFAAFINYAATFAVSFVLSLYLQYIKGFNPQEAGSLLMAQPMMMAVVAIIAGRMSDRFNPHRLTALGMAFSVLGLFLLSFLSLQTDFSYILIALLVLGFGFGLFSSPNTHLVMQSVDSTYYSVASATIATMRNSGMMFSMAVAAFVLHVFVGNERITSVNEASFVRGSNWIFAVFSALCLLGVLLILKGKRSAKILS